MGELLGGVAAILSGGVTGLLGVVAQRIFDHLKVRQETEQLKLRHEHERELRRIDAEIMREEWAQRVKVAEVEGETAREVADAQAFAASFNEPQRYSEGVKVGKFGAAMLVILDFLRGIVRPGLTLYLAWIATELYLDSQRLLGGMQVDLQSAVDMLRQITAVLLYLFTTCVLWWFGTRNKAPQPRVA